MRWSQCWIFRKTLLWEYALFLCCQSSLGFVRDFAPSKNQVVNHPTYFAMVLTSFYKQLCKLWLHFIQHELDNFKYPKNEIFKKLHFKAFNQLQLLKMTFTFCCCCSFFFFFISPIQYFFFLLYSMVTQLHIQYCDVSILLL